MGKIIAAVNEKGGVAKTTTIKNLSIGIASKGKKVLVLDLDPSGNFTKSLGLDNEGEEGTICEIIGRTIEFEDLDAGFGIVHCDEGIDVITSSNALHYYESKLSQSLQREVVLRRYLATVKDKYDYIFLDCPAGLGIFVLNALFACDYFIIPTAANMLDVAALQNVFPIVSQVRKMNGTNKKPGLLGILFTAVRLSTTNHKEIMEFYRKSDSMNVFNSYIALNSKIPESDLAKQSIFKYSKNCIAALNYMDLVEEVLSMVEQDEIIDSPRA